MEGADGVSAGPVVRAFGRATYRPSLFGAVGAGTVAQTKGDVIAESLEDDDNVYVLESDDEEDKENRTAKPVPAAFLLGPRVAEADSEVETQKQMQTQTQEVEAENETEAQIGADIDIGDETEAQDVALPSRHAMRRAIATLASEAAMDWSLRTWVQRLADDLGVSADVLAAEKSFIRDVVTDIASERAEELQSQAQSQSQSQLSQMHSQVTQMSQMSQMSQADELFDGADDDNDNDDGDDGEARPHGTWAEAQR